jgi:predicted nucleotidyltransferase component of viral defense system
MIHQETITPKMHEIARVIYARLDALYYLAGGTALALLSGHRESVDLDYFIPRHIDTQKLKDTLLNLFPHIIFTYEEIDTLWCSIEEVKVSFISRLAPCLDAFQDEEGFRIAGVHDLVVMKLNAICGRDEYKDYYDLAELATLTDAREWPALWGKVYPQSDLIAWIVALSHVGSVAHVPLRGHTVRSNQEVEEIIQTLVKELSPFA